MKRKSTKINCKTCKNVPENYFMMNCVHKICIECVLENYQKMKKNENLNKKNIISCDYCDKKTLLQKETLKYFEKLISQKKKNSILKKDRKKKEKIKKKSILKKKAPKKKIYSKSILQITKKKSFVKRFNSKSQIFKKPPINNNKGSNSTRVLRSSKFSHRDNFSKFISVKKIQKNDRKSEISSLFEIRLNSERNGNNKASINSKLNSVRNSAFIAKKNFKKKKKKKIVKIKNLKIENFNIFLNLKKNFNDLNNKKEISNEKLDMKLKMNISDINNDNNFSNNKGKFLNENFKNDYFLNNFMELKKDIGYLKNNIDVFKSNLYFSKLEKNLDILKNLDCIKKIQVKNIESSFSEIKNFVQHQKKIIINSETYKKLYIKNNDKNLNILKLIESDIVLKSTEILNKENELSRFFIELKTDLNRKFDFILNNLLNKKNEVDFHFEKMGKENRYFYKRLKNFLFSFKRNLHCYKLKKNICQKKSEDILNDYNLELEKFENEKKLMEEKKIKMNKNRGLLENLKQNYLEKISNFFKIEKNYKEETKSRISHDEPKNNIYKMISRVNKKLNFQNLRIDDKKREMKKEKLSTFQQRLIELKQNNFFK